MLESIRIGAILLHPFLPYTAEKIFEQLNTKITDLESIKCFGQIEAGKKLNEPVPLFIRINKEEFLDNLAK